MNRLERSHSTWKDEVLPLHHTRSEMLANPSNLLPLTDGERLTCRGPNTTNLVSQPLAFACVGPTRLRFAMSSEGQGLFKLGAQGVNRTLASRLQGGSSTTKLTVLKTWSRSRESNPIMTLTKGLGYRYITTAQNGCGRGIEHPGRVYEA